MIRVGILTHGGVGSPASASDGCRAAAERGFGVLARGGHALDAVEEAAAALEDDGRFNAGRGSVLRLDGRTIEMDAALMDSEGRLGAVAAIQRVRNPVRVARHVLETPHVLLCGAGALEFARRRGHADFYEPTPAARERYARARAALQEGKFDEFREAWRTFDLRGNWNFGRRYEEIFEGDTIGAVAIDREGRLAVANSTGGSTPMMLGRVGDSPIIGCGFYAGPAAAVATTGIGEEIIRRTLARRAYDEIASGEEVAAACRRAVELFPREIPVGVIAVGRRGWGAAHNRDMAHAISVE